MKPPSSPHRSCSPRPRRPRRSPIQDASVSFGADDPTFATAPAAGSVAQTATATFSYISYKFFKAAIHADLPGNGGEPWEPEEPGEEEP